jgi:hypothetical protein
LRKGFRGFALMVNGGLSLDTFWGGASTDAACFPVGRGNEEPGIYYARKNPKVALHRGASRRRLRYRVAIRSNSSSIAACLARGSGWSDNAKPTKAQ